MFLLFYLYKILQIYICHLLVICHYMKIISLFSISQNINIRENDHKHFWVNYCHPFQPLNNCSLLKSDHIHPKHFRTKIKIHVFCAFLCRCRKNRQEVSLNHSNSQHTSLLYLSAQKSTIFFLKKILHVGIVIWLHWTISDLFHFLTINSLFLQHVQPPDVPPVQG